MFFKKQKRQTNEDRIIVNDNTLVGKAEGYNRLRDNIMYLNADGNKKVIQIESSVAHEGKTTIASNLAVALGLTDKKVVVIDLDFRKPKVHRRFELSNENGLAEYMLGSIEKKDLIKKTKYKNVSIINRGSKIYNSTVVIVSEKFKNLIKELREEFDYVILDCAPVLQVSDYIHISQVSDGILFVVAYAKTTKAQVSEAIKELKNNNATILGSIFSMYDAKKDKSYYGSYKGYYYGKGYYSYYKPEADDESEDEVINKE